MTHKVVVCDMSTLSGARRALHGVTHTHTQRALCAQLGRKRQLERCLVAADQRREHREDEDRRLGSACARDARGARARLLCGARTRTARACAGARACGARQTGRTCARGTAQANTGARAHAHGAAHVVRAQRADQRRACARAREPARLCAWRVARGMDVRGSARARCARAGKRTAYTARTTRHAERLDPGGARKASGERARTAHVRRACACGPTAAMDHPIRPTGRCNRRPARRRPRIHMLEDVPRQNHEVPARRVILSGPRNSNVLNR